MITSRIRRVARYALLFLAFTSVVPASAQDAPAPAVSGEEALERAFQKEYAYLASEKASLVKRLAEYDADAARRIAEAEQALAAAQETLLTLQQQADDLDRQREASIRRQARIAEGASALDAVVSQMAITLEAEPLPPEAPLSERLERVQEGFDASLTRAAALGALSRANEDIFLPDGKEVSADVLRVGQIAAFGVSAEGAGALLPAGAGRLQVFGSSDPNQARQVLGGAPPEAVGVFLFESANKRADPPKEKTFDDTLRAGGAIGKVILGLGAALFLMALWRAVTLLRCQGGTVADAESVAFALRDGDTARASTLAAAVRGSMGRVLQALAAKAGHDRNELEVVAEQGMDREHARLDRFSTALVVGASVAPLLGLLGTVSGMIATFDVLTEHGAGNPKLLSGGISEALVTTQLGLIVAIPGVLVGNLLSSRARELAAAAESAAILVLHHVARRENEADATDGSDQPPGQSVRAIRG